MCKKELTGIDAVVCPLTDQFVDSRCISIIDRHTVYIIRNENPIPGSVARDGTRSPAGCHVGRPPATKILTMMTDAVDAPSWVRVERLDDLNEETIPMLGELHRAAAKYREGLL